VITKFVYDPDLSDGWATTPTGVVYGVEAQQLTFQEYLMILTIKRQADATTTLFDESDNDHRFLYLELRNVSPFPVELDMDEAWRIARVETVSGNEAEQCAAQFKKVGTSKPINPGENYLMACHDGLVKNGASQQIGSEFYVDYTGGSELEMVAPKNTLTPTTVASNSTQPYATGNNAIDLDMTAYNASGTSDNNYVQFTKPGGSSFTGTTLLEFDATNSQIRNSFTLSLQRRLNPYIKGVKPGGNSEEWVEVDRIVIDNTKIWKFNTPTAATSSPTQADNATALNTIISQERFHHFTSNISDSTVTTVPKHSMDVAPATKQNANDRFYSSPPSTYPSSSEIRVYQPHFDRDFTSIMDLLSIPLYGHRNSTETTTFSPGTLYSPEGGVAYNIVDNTNDQWRARLAGFNTAQVRFLFPNAGATAGSPGALPVGHPFTGKVPSAYQNRWYRLFAFVGLDPTSADDAVESRLQTIRRAPGKINLNTLRHEHVLAGLVDDDIVHDGVANVQHPTNDAYDSPARNWMSELQFARDQIDEFSPFLGARYGITSVAPNAVPGLPLPGLPIAKPFRPAAQLDSLNADSSVSSALFRFGVNARGQMTANTLAPNSNPPVLPNTAAGATNLPNLGLFEARDTSDVGSTKEIVDPHARHRLLAKIANNTTNRSHVFAIWAGFDLHEAHYVTLYGAQRVQIGGKADDLPSRRMFCIVDMSRLEEAYDPASGTFDFRKFIIHRQLLP
jgi:hypothetical protein